MEKEFVPYELAIRMKALDYSEPYFGWYDQFKLKKEYHPLKDSGSQEYMRIEDCTAPTFSQAFRWFREKYNLYSQLEYFHSPKWTYSILEFTDLKITPTKIALGHSKERTYEEAELACLSKIIEIVENRLNLNNEEQSPVKFLESQYNFNKQLFKSDFQKATEMLSKQKSSHYDEGYNLGLKHGKQIHRGGFDGPAPKV